MKQLRPRIRRAAERFPGIGSLLGWRSALMLARSSKRLDLCAAQLAHMLHRAGIDVREKRCLEMGAGATLTHSIAMWLAGAKQVKATDIARMLHVSATHVAVQSANESVIREILSPFDDPERIRTKLSALQSAPRLGLEELRRLGIGYRAPFAPEVATEEKCDLVFSFSVLEHIAPARIQSVLQGFVDMVVSGGHLLHSIHLEDHLDIRDRPFRFLDAHEPFDEGNDSLARGNRVRASRWLREFASLAGVDTTVLYAHRRLGPALPRDLTSAVSSTDEDDLRISHLGVLMTRR